MENPNTYIIENLNLSNPQLAAITGLSVWQVKYIIQASNLTRSKEQREAIMARKGELQTGASNSNWKGGIAGDHYRYKKVQRERYPEKIAARMKLYNAVKKGILKKQPCEICNDIESEAHHFDYSKPLDVRWLCKVHHKNLHRLESLRRNVSNRLTEQLTLCLY